MPIYEYQCKRCGQFEIMQKITEPPLIRCPKCHTKVTKLISNTSFQLKGSGWYITDYGRKDSGAKEPSGTKEQAKETKGDSQDTAKAENVKDATPSPSKSKAKTKEAAAA